MARLENLADTLNTIRDRLQHSDRPLPSASLPSQAREAVGAVATTGISSLLVSALPGLLTALGWTTPPSLAAILALRVGLAILRRRAERKRSSSQSPHDNPSKWKPLNDQYAAQLNEVYALSGHSTTADATLGREYDRELCEMESGADDNLSQWAHSLRRRVADRFYRIHDETPLPAEPMGKTE